MMLRRLFVSIAFVLAALTPAAAQDPADVVVRLNRLETLIRQMSGQIEELQHENRQLKDQLRRFQEDVEFRFQEGRGGSRTAPSRPSQPQPPPQPQRRGDAFDPAQTPNAPGAPLPLGTTPPSAPLASSDIVSPMPLPGGAIADLIENGGMDEGAELAEEPDLTGRTAAVPPASVAAPRASPSVAATSLNDPRAEFETAYAYFTQGQYDHAEMGFRRFLQSHPRDRLVPEAAYWLGETYLQGGRYREAAEQFLNVSTEHPNAEQAPAALLKLGVSLHGLGASERACAVYAEIPRKYPRAPASVRQGAEREQKRAKCG